MDSLFHIQGPQHSDLTPVFLIHAISGFGLPYLNLGSLATNRTVYGLSSPTHEKASYRLPHSLQSLAQEYLATIRSVQPQGPYILGGWSLGGMVAAKIASILQEESGDGESQVLKLLLIDAINPEGCPAYSNPKERDATAEWMFKTYAPQMNLGYDPDSDFSSDEEEEMPALDSDSESDSDDDDDVDVDEFLPRLKKYIYNSLDLVAGAGSTKVVPEEGLKCPATLVKCNILGDHPPGTSEKRKWAVEYRFNDRRSGWPIRDLKVVRVDRQHDHMFDGDFVGEMTGILREDLEGVEG
ncbi:putative secondary metabolism biosynthetic enzyme [Bacidia gigantensis]|uniref:putative secondary metabolism biosynthetic enzyme n=1 Tax=Bacidia gigantensis TaxID=2732470 RepID=UPI001D03AF2A|nr:putative secondary metabolism biosynthetic enzyme [Bacidia gigantensis]KAG8528373.1 putative secondary metabolism biosynthetic enzyme [Bacidia gigantensis]